MNILKNLNWVLKLSCYHVIHSISVSSYFSYSIDKQHENLFVEN